MLIAYSNFECVCNNLPTAFLNWFVSMLISFEMDGWIVSKTTSLSWFDSYNIWRYAMAACKCDQIQTITVCLSRWEFRITKPSFFSELISPSIIWCERGFALLLRSSSLLWSSSCVSNNVFDFEPRVCTYIFITPRPTCKCQNTQTVRRSFRYYMAAVWLKILFRFLANHWYSVYTFNISAITPGDRN